MINDIKKQIKELYETAPDIHVNVTISHPRVNIKCAPVVIKGIYPNIFVIEESECGYPRRHSHQYADIVTGKIEIIELGQK